MLGTLSFAQLVLSICFVNTRVANILYKRINYNVKPLKLS